MDVLDDGSLMKCVLVDGVCSATKDEHCVQSSVCQQEGKCSAADGTCKVTKDMDCTQSRLCQSRGLCSAIDGECRSVKDEDCLHSELCKNDGYCSAVKVPEGIFVLTINDHSLSSFCLRRSLRLSLLSC